MLPSTPPLPPCTPSSFKPSHEIGCLQRVCWNIQEDNGWASQAQGQCDQVPTSWIESSCLLGMGHWKGGCGGITAWLLWAKGYDPRSIHRCHTTGWIPRSPQIGSCLTQPDSQQSTWSGPQYSTILLTTATKTAVIITVVS